VKKQQVKWWWPLTRRRELLPGGAYRKKGRPCYSFVERRTSSIWAAAIVPFAVVLLAIGRLMQVKKQKEA